VTEITGDHVEWALVDRLRQMLEELPLEKFNVTQTYALFTAVMCWVVGRIRVTEKEIKSAPEGLRSRINNELSVQDHGAAENPEYGAITSNLADWPKKSNDRTYATAPIFA